MYSLLESDTDVRAGPMRRSSAQICAAIAASFSRPRNICQMAVHMLDPGERQLILDPACGTGGFLITAMNYVIEKIGAAEIEKWGNVERAETAIRQRVQHFAKTFIVGIDLNPNLVKASKINMVMNNGGTGGLFQGNSLKPAVTWNEAQNA
jgi:type I restriction enzyme M protein